MKIFLQLFLAFIIFQIADAQTEIPVNLYTGAPGISVSLGSIGGHGISDEISLYYSASQVAQNARKSYFGLGWNLGAGGSIVREVRGLPDDHQGSSSDMRRGWLYDQSNVNTGSFSNSSDNSSVTCTDELADYNYINGLAFVKDTEPDIFYYSIPGHSGSFIFDNAVTPVIRLIPYADIKVEPRFVFNTKNIIGFKLTTNDGVQYIFNTSSTETKSATPVVTTPPVEFEKTSFQLYNKTSTTPAISYKYGWSLDSVRAPNSGYLFYTYKIDLEKDVRYAPEVNLTVASYKYGIEAREVRRKLTAIYSSSGTAVFFNYSNKSNAATSDDSYQLLSEVVYNDSRKTDGNQFYKKYSIVYNYYYPCPTGCGEIEAGFNRAFIKSVREESTCSKNPPYEFSYITPEKFPLPLQNSIDAWGYYNRSNPQLPGKVYVYPQLAPHEQYRIFPITNYAGEKYEMAVGLFSFLPSEDSTKIGTLKSIKFPTGGTATLDFGLHEFYDALAQETYKAGGLRINKITYSDGLDNLKNIVVNYTYKTDANISSGKLLAQPKYSIPTDEYKASSNPITYSSYQQLVAQGNNPWTYLAYKSYPDVQDVLNQSSVVYAMAKVAKAGQGYSITEFSTPATWGESSNGEWSASTVKIARSASCNTVDFIKSGTHNIYPYPPNPIYTYAQGLPIRVRQFSEQGVRVKETIYTYQDIYKAGSTAFKVWGLSYEKVPYWTDGYLFSKYFLLTDANRLISTATTNEYDANNLSKFATTVQSYFYQSTAHKLLSRVEQTNPDGTKYTVRYKYPLDFGVIAPTASEAALMIKKLQDSFRNGSPLESYTTVTQGGAPEVTIAASTSILSAFSGTDPLVKYELALKATEVATFVPATIQSNLVKVDTRYDTINTYLSYLPYATPASSVGDDRLSKGIVTGYNQTATVVEVSNAVPEQVAFSDFETTSSRSFDVTGTVVNGAPRSGNKSIQPTVTLSKQVKKGNDKYYLSLWVFRKHATVVNLYVKNVAKTQTFHSQTINFTAGGSAFEYVEYLFPIDASLTDFVVELQCTVTSPPANPSLMPLIDDVAVYPAVAELKTNTYSLPFGVNSTTNRDQTAYVQFDDLGRVTVKKDKDGNIRERNTYYYPGMAPPSFEVSYSYSMPASLSQPVTFSAQAQSCSKGLTYQWDFGQGYVAGTETMTNTFTSLGTRTVRLKITHPIEGVKEYSSVVDVKIPPEQAAYFTTSAIPDGGGLITFTARDNSSLGSAVVYEWNFGQGYVAGAREITQAVIQSQTVQLRVSSNNAAVPTQVYSRFIKIVGTPQ